MKDKYYSKSSLVRDEQQMVYVPRTSPGLLTMPGIWPLGKPLGHFHTDEGTLQDSKLNAKARKSSSKSNYLRSSAALDVSPADHLNPLLESSLASTQCRQ